AEQVIERRRGLQIPQAWCVGRGDVHGEVARHVVEPFDPQHIIGRAVCAFLVRPEVDADHTNSRALLQTLENDLMARAVEAESIDDGPFTDKSENARPRVPDLRARGDAADLGKAKSNSQ